MEPKKYEYIDSLRGIAILLVIMSHLWTYCENAMSFLTYTEVQLFAFGIHGVQLFFIVSSFTLMLSFQSRKHEQHALRNYFIRRFFRIAPMFYLAIIFYTFFKFLVFTPNGIDWTNFPFDGLIMTTLFINGFSPDWLNGYVPGGWSVAVEFMFYFTLPIICKYITNINRSFLFVLVTFFMSLVLNLLLKDTSVSRNFFLYWYFPNQLPVFSLGILIFFIIRDKISDIKPYSLLLLIAILIFVRFFSVTYSSLILSSIAFFFLLLVLKEKPYKFLSNKILASIGKYSFSMYLIHFMIFEIGVKYLQTNMLINIHNHITAIIGLSLYFIIVFVLTYSISYITYTYVEVPGQNLGRKLIKKLNDL